MYYTLTNLDILFRGIQPEDILEEYRKHNSWSMPIGNIVTERIFDRSSRMNLKEYTLDERRLRYDYVKNSIEKYHEYNQDIFGFLVEFSEQILRFDGKEPVCKIECIEKWHEAYNYLGQDIYVLSWLAYRDSKMYSGHIHERTMQYSFRWPAVIRSDDYRLNCIIDKGLAENHFHLKGSTQNFALTWICLMNHPEVTKHLFEKKKCFEVNLKESLFLKVDDYAMPWQKRIKYAAMIRALLFQRALSLYGKEDFSTNDLIEKFNDFDMYDRFIIGKGLNESVRYLRYSYGDFFYQCEGGKKCIDYAISSKLYKVDKSAFTRLLSGERCFLYQCFWMQFSGVLTEKESKLFYIYLLIKSNFRAEIVQSNHVPGFYNFGLYQDRKDILFEDFKEYDAENYRLSIAESIEANSLVSLEARIVPKDNLSKLVSQIENIDNKAEMAILNRSCSKIEYKIYHEAEKTEGYTAKKYFYVAHFVKERYDNDNYVKEGLLKKKYMLKPRNYKVRQRARQQAIALSKYFKRCSSRYIDFGARIKGIDACNVEIGCRPETFATEFRYLRQVKNLYAKNEFTQCLGVTYHVGEDFLDIIDGLRAVDEAICFVQLHKGDRIGHGLVLGIEPDVYYQDRHYEIFVSCQDRLDDIVWTLRRSIELNVKIPITYREKLKTEARHLFYIIYHESIKRWFGDVENESIDFFMYYYDSMKLRGDHPDLYITGQFSDEMKDLNYVGMYRKCMINGVDLQQVRENKKASFLFYLYHFDFDVKEKGLNTISIDIDKEYISVAKDIQRAMREYVVDKGLSIECNPTSNVLIGTFHTYDEHPLFQFNKHKLEKDVGQRNIPVSINTDDLGVFDTSLAHEYAMMFSAIRRKRHAEGNYNDEDIYEYLDYLRELGIGMVFQ